MNLNVSSTGDLGDIVVLIGVLSGIPGKHTVLLCDSAPGEAQTKGILKRKDLIIPLVKAQEYIADCREMNGERPTWKSQDFRKGFHKPSSSLMSAHAAHAISVGVIQQAALGDKPWLKIKPDNSVAKRILICRSARYHNQYMPWKNVVDHYGKRIIFVGLPEEHQMFCSAFGEVEYRPVKDLLEMGKLIAGCALYMGNQTVGFAIAEGIKHPRIQETCLFIPDCIYPGSTNAQWCYDGQVTLPDVDGSGELYLETTIPSEVEINPSIVPPGGWQYPGMGTHNHLNALKAMMCLNLKIEPAEALRRIADHNTARLPDFFVSPQREAALRFVRPALQNAL